MPEVIASSAVRVGAVRGRYFRENFAYAFDDPARQLGETSSPLSRRA